MVVLNAASTLVALNKLWDTRLTTHELAELGLQLGADVPAFIHGKAAFAEGVGEKITYCEPLEKYYVILNQMYLFLLRLCSMKLICLVIHLKDPC